MSLLNKLTKSLLDKKKREEQEENNMICIECGHEVDYFEVVEFFGDKYGRCRQCAEGDDE